MTVTLEQIKAPISEELERFESTFKNSMKTSVPLLNTIMNYIVKRKGKQIRPIFVLYSAASMGGINEKTHRAASLVELLHTATLVHDDVVDESDMRRGFFSINALWKNKIAVLVGDYLLSKGLLLSVEYKDYDLLEIVSHAVKEMSEGELLQLEKARSMNATEEIYFEIIRKKTASLIASCCAVGSASAGASSEQIKSMHRFGELIGLAFQIRDDLFDFGDNHSGKPTGIDIKEKKLTLPILYALSKSSHLENRKIKNIIRSNKNHKEKMNLVLSFIENYGGLDYARNKMVALKEDAFTLLRSTAMNNQYADNMENLVNFVIERNK